MFAERRRINIKTLWVITARAGSKGIPNKNIKLLQGTPLMGYAIKALLQVYFPEDVWLSTDSEAYASIGRELGATVPFLRPAELAVDNARSIDALLHAMNYAEENGAKYDFIGLVQPTSPFIKPDYYREAVGMLADHPESQSIISVKDAGPSVYFAQEEDKYLSVTASRIISQKVLRRQDVKKYIAPSGAFYIARWQHVKEQESLYFDKTLAYDVPLLHSADMDEQIDWMWAEFLLEKGLIEIPWVSGAGKKA